ncbi:putative Peroxidase 48 [Carica papaya]|uniref:putative Peroxidase 48 n=1 Tax=Carica papaya TaxID=3649 RepID=UPI000B8CEAA1|nr:putative Peroxidase 48 [Carica papaya]
MAISVKKWMFLILVVVVALLLSPRTPKHGDERIPFYFVPIFDPAKSTGFLQSDGEESIFLDPPVLDSGLQYDYYRDTCPQAEAIVRSKIARVYAEHRDIYAGFLRLLFHDCFIQGCDASIFLNDRNEERNRSAERQAVPNKSLRGFDQIDWIKEELEKACPGVVSCADTLVLATRDSLALAGGPVYPVFTGRRDSTESYYAEAMTELPRPDGNITETLGLFNLRGFGERETVTLLGAHNVGKIACQFFQSRLSNFFGTGQPDPTIPSDFLTDLRSKCAVNDSTNKRRSNIESSLGTKQGVSSISVSSGDVFDTHYYQRLLRGRGILFADQQLMADERTARFVRTYASDDGSIFRREFGRVMVKLSNLGVLTGNQGVIRVNCSLPVDHIF